MIRKAFSGRGLLLALTVIVFTSLSCGVTAQDKPVTHKIFVLNDFDKTLDFTYVDWKDKVTASNGHLILKDVKCSGGGGVNFKMDLSAYANSSPALKIKANPANKGKGLYIIISDNKGHSGRWIFQVPAPADDFTIVTAKGSSALTNPNVKEDKENPDKPGNLDLTNITQFHVGGDWSKEILDVEIDALLFVEPDAKMLADREAYVKVQAEEAAEAARKAAEEKKKEETKRQNMIRSYSYSGENSPKLVNVSLVAPDILSLTVEAQWITPSTIVKYEPQEGDELKEEKWPDGGANNGIRKAKLMRNGKFMGTLQGIKLDWLTNGEHIAGDPFLYFLADDPNNFTVTSQDDSDYANGVKPAKIYRKTIPTNVPLPGGNYATRHRVYLKMPSPLKAGKTYSVKTEKINLKNPNPTFTVDYAKMLSEAVHVNQNGYHPNDPYKRALLSLWMGTGGGLKFPDGLNFSVVEDGTGKPVFNGKVELVMDIDGKENLWTKPAKNYAQTAVYKMDFSAFNTPGTYRVCVEGIGSSYPFQINESVWEKAFQLQMKGLYNNRSGIEVGPPYSEYKKPRDFHPDDGAVVTRATFDVMEKGQYNMKDLPKTDTGEVIKNAWGGYHDAGDWNPRRVTHMNTNFSQLELIEIMPEYFSKLKLNIPPTSGEGLPDIITEALWEIDCFKRIQLPDGGIPYGIESQMDPGSGEISWLSTQHLYVLAPNIRDSWFYAAVAARAAKVLQTIKPEIAKEYLDSAVKAFNWAEADYAKKVADKTLDKMKGELWQAKDWRNASSLVLYDITGDKKYHDVFMEGTFLKKPGQDICSWGGGIQTDAAFLYARLDDAKADPEIKKNARAAVLRIADFSMDYAKKNAFNVTCREAGRPMFAGFFSVSGGMEVARAHFLTSDKKYLEGAIQSCQFGMGCNPGNLVYTTGMGSNPIKNPLQLDARSSGQPAPVGLTSFGNSDIWNFRGSFWDINMQFVNKPEQLWPDVYSWPLQEAYFDVWILVSTNEFVIDTWQQNVFVWGYLAAQKR